MTRKLDPGETMMMRLLAREKKVKAVLAQLDEQKRQVRDRVTGKLKAQAYVRRWLETLTATELGHECEIRGYLYVNFETMDEAMNAVVCAMFSGVVVQGEMWSSDDVPVSLPPPPWNDSSGEGDYDANVY